MVPDPPAVRGGRVVVVGSLNVDLVVRVEALPRPGETVRGTDLRRTAGGKGLNQAVAAARFGVPVALVGCVGDDDDGRLLRAVVAEEGIDDEGVLDVHRPTGTASVTVGPEGANTIVVSPGANAVTDGASAAAAAPGGADVVLAQAEVPETAVLGRVRGGPCRRRPHRAQPGAVPPVDAGPVGARRRAGRQPDRAGRAARGPRGRAGLGRPLRPVRGRGAGRGAGPPRPAPVSHLDRGDGRRATGRSAWRRRQVAVGRAPRRWTPSTRWGRVTASPAGWRGDWRSGGRSTDALALAVRAAAVAVQREGAVAAMPTCAEVTDET